jgi:hypothetical protein
VTTERLVHESKQVSRSTSTRFESITEVKTMQREKKPTLTVETVQFIQIGSNDEQQRNP